MTHKITERRSPINIMVFCTCGWRHQETRRQNARARTSRVQAAVTRHFRAVEAQEPPIEGSEAT